jgi:tryptophan-rich sensory protein
METRMPADEAQGPGRTGARSAVALGASFAAAAATAGIGGLVTDPGEDWYVELDKPSWQPPGQVFGPVWGVLYSAQAVAAWLVWKRDGSGSDRALQLYGAQLLLNAGWTLLFFGLHRLSWAVFEIAALWIAIAATMAAFRRHSPVAFWLLVPYLAWVSFAAALSYSIWRRNR